MHIHLALYVNFQGGISKIFSSQCSGWSGPFEAAGGGGQGGGDQGPAGEDGHWGEAGGAAGHHSNRPDKKYCKIISELRGHMQYCT